MSDALEIGHSRVTLVEAEIFLTRFAADCMTHTCRCKDNDEGDRVLLDACCQHGADVDLWERDAILARAADIAPVLAAPWRDPARWFDQSEPEVDPDFPSGIAVRTAVSGADEASGCVFLQHDARGCALHLAAEAVKPAVCRLYPLAFGDGLLGLSDDFWRYSCAGDLSGPSVYRLMRDTLVRVFDRDLIGWLDAVEQRVLARRLPLLAG